MNVPHKLIKIHNRKINMKGDDQGTERGWEKVRGRERGDREWGGEGLRERGERVLRLLADRQEGSRIRSHPVLPTHPLSLSLSLFIHSLRRLIIRSVVEICLELKRYSFIYPVISRRKEMWLLWKEERSEHSEDAHDWRKSDQLVKVELGTVRMKTTWT